MSTEHPGIPTGVNLIIERDSRVLLMRRANTGFFDGLFSLPGGHVEAGESIEMTACREAGEELGLHLDASRLNIVGVIHRMSDTNRIDFIVRASGWHGEPRRAEPDKCDELEWFARTALPGALVPYVREALRTSLREPWIMQLGW